MHRTQFLNQLIRVRGLRHYLEIGCDRDGTFNAVQAETKVGVDPVRGGTVRLTSDAFFATNSRQFDLIFIDGLHLREQVLRDVDGGLQCLSPQGIIVLHDCLPQRIEHQQRERRTVAWTGDVWKAVIDIRQRLNVDLATLDADWGLGVILKRPNSAPLAAAPLELNWDTYVAHRDSLLRVMNMEGMMEFIGTQVP